MVSFPGWSSITSAARGVTSVLGAVGMNGITAAAGAYAAGVPETVYDYKDNRFPDDLGVDQNSHVLSIRAYTGGSTSTGGWNAPDYNAYTAFLYIPGSGQEGGSPLIYDHQHNFADIRLTNIINDSLLGVAMTMNTRRQINPMVQALYRSTNLRQFDFNFMLAPRNLNESKSIEEIVTNIRAYAAPEFKSGAVISPAEFEFQWLKMYNGQLIENSHLPKIDRCIITKVIANFAPAGTWSSFRNGYPMATQLTFSATEIRVIDRSKIKPLGGY